MILPLDTLDTHSRVEPGDLACSEETTISFRRTTTTPFLTPSHPPGTIPPLSPSTLSPTTLSLPLPLPVPSTPPLTSSPPSLTNLLPPSSSPFPTSPLRSPPVLSPTSPAARRTQCVLSSPPPSPTVAPLPRESIISITSQASNATSPDDVIAPSPTSSSDTLNPLPGTDCTIDSDHDASVAEVVSKSAACSSCCHNNCVSRDEFQMTTQALQAENSALRSALHEARQFFKIELDALATRIHHLQSTSPNPSSSNPHRNSSPRPQSHSKSKNKKQSSSKASPPPSINNSTPQPPPLPSDDKVKTNSIQVPPREEYATPQPPTPHPPQHTTVSKDTTTILLGDCIMKGVDLSRSSPPNSTSQKVSINELTVPQLTEWLKGQTPTPTVTRATLHVGIHDCRQTTTSAENAISRDKWKDLLSQCRRVFPKASLQASAILPARGRHPLNAVIRPSNRNLQMVCDSMGVKFTDHTAVFTTTSGAPRMALYKDAILPTKKGTARLAENLFPPHSSGKATKPGNTDRPRSTYAPSHPPSRSSNAPSHPPSRSSNAPCHPPYRFSNALSQPPSRSSNAPSHLPSRSSNTPSHPLSGPSTSSTQPSLANYNHQTYQPLRSSPILPTPNDPFYSDSFPPLPHTVQRHPPPPPSSITTQRTGRREEQHRWSPPPPLMQPRVPVLYPPFHPPGFPASWHWPHFMPVPPFYSQFP